MFVWLCFLISVFAQAQVSLDTHFHVDRSPIIPILFSKVADIEREIQISPAQYSFLISKAYVPQYWTRESDVTSWAIRTNAEVSDVVTRSMGRGIGVCGLDIAWDTAADILKDCLALPGMKGIKFHFRAGHESLRDPVHARKFVALARQIEAAGAFVLIHLNVDESPLEEIEEFFKVTVLFPKTKFIIAHGGRPHPALLNWIANRYSLEPYLAKNIFTEVSNAFNFMKDKGLDHEESPQKYFEAWRRFGIERVLFGSDFPLDSASNTRNLVLDSGLGPEEKEKILYWNGLEFLKSIQK